MRWVTLIRVFIYFYLVHVAPRIKVALVYMLIPPAHSYFFQFFDFKLYLKALHITVLTLLIQCCPFFVRMWFSIFYAAKRPQLGFTYCIKDHPYDSTRLWNGCIIYNQWKTTSISNDPIQLFHILSSQPALLTIIDWLQYMHLWNMPENKWDTKWSNIRQFQMVSP